LYTSDCNHIAVVIIVAVPIAVFGTRLAFFVLAFSVGRTVRINANSGSAQHFAGYFFIFLREFLTPNHATTVITVKAFLPHIVTSPLIEN